MDLSTFGIAGVAVITVICYLIGQTVKASGLDNKWIPIIVGASGGALGIAGMLMIVSGLAATGVNQINKQMRDCRQKDADGSRKD